MKRFVTYSSVALLSAGLFVSVGGCQNKTESEKAREQSMQVDDAADKIAAGERNVADGEAMIARGEAMKKNGDTVGGETMISDGKIKKQLGQTQLSEGKAMKDRAMRR
jgi:hypothetical protein